MNFITKINIQILFKFYVIQIQLFLLIINIWSKNKNNIIHMGDRKFENPNEKKKPLRDS